MADETLQTNEPYLGEEIFSWSVDEYERHERGPLWYAIASIVGVALVLYAVISQNFLFAVIIIMAGVIIGLSTLREPMKVNFQMTTRGIGIGNKFTPYKSMRSFWIIYEPPMTKNLYFDFGSAVTPHLVVPLEDQDPVEVRAALMEFLREELTQDSEPLSELLGRVLKL